MLIRIFFFQSATEMLLGSKKENEQVCFKHKVLPFQADNNYKSRATTNQLFLWYSLPVFFPDLLFSHSLPFGSPWGNVVSCNQASC